MRGIRLVQVYPPPDTNEADTNADIIAIHGLDTKSPDTWIWRDRDDPKKPDVKWLEDPTMLPNRVQTARIFTCDWPASLFKNSDSIEMTITELARALLSGIQSMRVRLDADENRPILFIASCLGGIVLIQSLILAAQPGSEYTSLWRATGANVFLATPFRGTAFHDIATLSVSFLNHYANLTGRVVTNLLNSVKTSTPFLQDLVGNFTEICRKRDQDNAQNHPCLLAIFYETGNSNLWRKVLPLESLADFLNKPKPVSARDSQQPRHLPSVLPSVRGMRNLLNILQLVDSVSARLDIVLNPIPLERPHGLMNKFSGPDDPGYDAVAGKIGEMLKRIRDFQNG
jgi:hypothetical protein